MSKMYGLFNSTSSTIQALVNVKNTMTIPIAAHWYRRIANHPICNSHSQAVTVVSLSAHMATYAKQFVFVFCRL